MKSLLTNVILCKVGTLYFNNLLYSLPVLICIVGIDKRVLKVTGKCFEMF